MAPSLSGSDIAHADESCQSTSSHSTDSTCFVPLTTSVSPSNDCESSLNIGKQDDTHSGVDSVEGGPESGVKIDTLDSSKESDQPSSNSIPPPVPLSKYVENNKCLLCGFESKAKDSCSIRKHLSVHLSDKGYECDTCKKKFRTKSALTRHQVIHKNVFPFSCDLCGKKYRRRGVLNHHMKNTHAVDRRKFKCELCDKVFAKNVSLKEHLRVHTGERPFVCSLCKKAFRLKKQLACHLRRHSAFGGKVFTQTCIVPQRAADAPDDKTPENTLKIDAFDVAEESDNRCSINREIIRPLYKYIKNNKCLLCGFESKAKELRDVRGHLFVHLTNKEFKCDTCGKRFRAPSRLMRHRIIHRNVIPFSCDQCGKKYRTRAGLKKHTKEMHGERREFKCEVCNKTLTSKSGLRGHLRIHTGERPYTCGLCKKSFMLRGPFSKHLSHDCAADKTHQIPHCSPSTHDSASSSAVVSSKSKTDLDYPELSSPPISLPDSVSTSSSCENIRNVEEKVCTQICDMPLSDVDSAVDRTMASSTSETSVDRAELSQQSISLPPADSTCLIPLPDSLPAARARESNLDVDGGVCLQLRDLPQSGADDRTAENTRACEGTPNVDKKLFTETCDLPESVAESAEDRTAENTRACESIPNADKKLFTETCDEPQSVAGSADDRTAGNTLKIDTSDAVEEPGDKGTINTELIRPLYKYMKNNICLLCGFQSEAKELRDVRKHLFVHVSNSRVFECDTCGKKFPSAPRLMRHRISHKKEFSCDQCDRKCRNRGGIEMHKRIRHGGSRTFKCEVCNNTFASNSDLRAHLRVHTGEQSHDSAPSSAMMSPMSETNIDRADSSNLSIKLPPSLFGRPMRVIMVKLVKKTEPKTYSKP